MSRKLELHHQHWKMKPIGSWTHQGVKYAVAIGGPFKIIVPTNEVQHRLRQDHPQGYYEYSWTVFKGDEPWFGGGNVIDVNHDRDHTEHARERMRLNAARAEAQWAIDEVVVT